MIFLQRYLSAIDLSVSLFFLVQYEVCMTKIFSEISYLIRHDLHCRLQYGNSAFIVHCHICSQLPDTIRARFKYASTTNH